MKLTEDSSITRIRNQANNTLIPSMIKLNELYYSNKDTYESEFNEYNLGNGLNGLSLSQLLVSPYQRLMKYVLLLKQLIKKLGFNSDQTNENENENNLKKKLDKLLQAFEHVVNKFNEARGKYELNLVQNSLLKIY